MSRAITKQERESAAMLCDLAKTKERLRDEMSVSATARVVIAHHRESIEKLEAHLADTRRELEAIRAHPIVVPRERERLPDTRTGRTIRLRINSTKAVRYCDACRQPTPESPTCTSLTLVLGFYADGRLGEVFVRLDRTRRADPSASFADLWATVFSYALQHGLEVDWMLAKARYLADSSAGVPMVWDEGRGDYVPHPTLKHVASAVDYVAAVLGRVIAGLPAVALSAEELATQSHAA